uniref:Uncharacterized protein n=1 Tax=Calidris pygmaea TaxID=425635 RepID=A0A8C3K1V7_9CHAR
MVSPTTGNTTNIQSSNSSTGNTTAKSTAVPTFITTVVSHANATTNDSSWITPVNTNTTNSSSAAPTSPAGAATGIPVSSTRGNGSSSPQVDPTQKPPVTSQGSTAPTQTPTAVLASSSSPSPSRAPAPLPTGVQLLRRVPLSFRIINRSFNESLRDPTSKDYRTLSHTVLTMTTCTCRRKSRGKLDLLSTKDSYHPMAEYPPYQSHGRYVSPNSKPNPYSQVRAQWVGTFTYTNPAATSDNL